MGEIAAAPIFRYGDERLYGASLIRPFIKSYEWVKPISYPIHPDSSLVYEYFIRLFHAIVGLASMAVTSPLALVGRVSQILHYHLLSEYDRSLPAVISIDGIKLPEHGRPRNGALKVYHGTDPQSSKSILRWGFDLSKSSLDVKLGRAAYLSLGEEVSAQYGKDQLILDLSSLDEKEIASLTESQYNKWMGKSLKKYKETKEISEEELNPAQQKEFNATIQKLFLRNGFRVIQYELQDEEIGSSQALAVYDTNYISIVDIVPSPKAEVTRIIQREALLN